MNQKDKNKLITIIKEASLLGGSKALEYFRASDLVVSNKSKSAFDPVTPADELSEEIMTSFIKSLRPLDTIYGEEKGISAGKSGYTWMLDPIDGTRAFISGAPVWTVLVALNEGDKPILGAIFQPFTKELVIGGFNRCQYFLSGAQRETKTRTCEKIENAVLFTTFPEIGSSKERLIFQSVSEKVKLTRYGMDAYAFLLLALGHVDLVIEAGLKPYDVRAPIAVIEAAGGVVTDWQGKKVDPEGGQILACGDRILHKKVVEILNTF